MAEWYTKIAEQVVGPLSAEQLKALADGGRLAPGDPVAKSSDGPWVAASRVKGLFELAAVDDESEDEHAPAPPVASTEQQPSLSSPPEEPPIPQPPVVMPSAGASRMPPVQPAAEPPANAATIPSESGPVGGFAIQTEGVAATERFQKRRATKPREPLNKKQKNARLVKWLAISITLGAVMLFCIPYLRALVRPAPAPVAASDPVVGDVDLGSASVSIDDAFGVSSRATDSSPRPPAAVQAKAAEEPVASLPAADAVGVTPVRVALDRPRMTSAAGRAGRPANRFLLVELELRTKDSDGSARFRGWSGYAKDISLTDARGVEYEMRTPQDFGNRFVDGQCREVVDLSAEEPTTDVVLFAWPEEQAPGLPSGSDELLRLRLPKAAYGEQGELRFEIPLSEIEVTEDAAERPRGAPPTAEPATSDNVEEDDSRPIRIPGLTD